MQSLQVFNELSGEATFQVVRLKKEGIERVLDGKEGMTFIVDKFTNHVDGRGKVAHVRDYRYGRDNWNGCAIWSLSCEQYELVG